MQLITLFNPIKDSGGTSYLNRFARMIRSMLDSSRNNLVTFYKDYETLKLFLELEQFRCSDKFQNVLKAYFS